MSRANQDAVGGAQYARCPDCQGVLRLPQQGLTSAQAKVRCGVCLNVFPVQAHLCEAPTSDLPGPPAQQAPPEPAPAPRPPRMAPVPPEVDDVYDPMAAERRRQAPVAEHREPPEEMPEPEPSSDLAASFKQALSEGWQQLPLPWRGQGRRHQGARARTEAASRPVPERREQRRVSWFVWGAIVLMLFMVLNTLYLNRDRLSQKAGLRPLLAGMCALTGCRLPPLRSLSDIHLLRRNIYTHPKYKGALVISFSFINRASFAQPYPRLRVRMTNSGGGVVAERAFGPADYLSNYFPDLRMKAAETVEVQLEVQDPGASATAFDLAFH